MKPIAPDAIRDLIQERLLDGRAIACDADLLLSGLLDSLGVMSLVGHLEELRGAPIPHQDVVIENFETVNAIAAYLNRT